MIAILAFVGITLAYSALSALAVAAVAAGSIAERDARIAQLEGFREL